MTKEWICVIGASGIAIAGYVLYKLQEYKTEQAIKRIMFRTENGVAATHYSSVLYVDKESEKFYIEGADKVYHALDFKGSVVKDKNVNISVTDKDFAFKLKNKKDIEAFEECIKVLKEIKEKCLKEAEEAVVEE